MLTLDGSHGGGQLLRTALSLSAVTGTPFRMTNIRGKRATIGLQHQHLTAVNALAQISNATVQGNTLHSNELTFTPGTTKSGDYTFDIGTAGSTTLVFQTVLPALLFAEEPTTITITGGTANPYAPPAYEIKNVFLWHLQKFGINIDFTIKKEGFYPAGGGAILFHVIPITTLKEARLLQRGDYITTHVHARTSKSLASRNVADRLINGFESAFPQDYRFAPFIDEDLDTASPGCYINAVTSCEHAVLGITTLGEKNTKAETIGKHCAEQLTALLASGAAVDPYTTDQLLIYLGLKGTGALQTSTITLHMETNMRVIESFLRVKFQIEGTTISVQT